MRARPLGAEGIVIDKCMARHRHQVWIKFLKEIDARKPPEIDLHLIADPRQQRDRRDT